MIIVASALISGETPSLIFENIIIGKVELPGPDTKLAIIKSSKLIAKDNNQPAIKDCEIRGKIIVKNTHVKSAPRSDATSIKYSSKFDNLA